MRKLSILLSGPCGDGVHERRRQCVVSLEAGGLKLASDVIDTGGIEALLDDRRNKCGELGLLPALLVRELDVDEVKTMEWVLVLNATEQVDAAVLAGVTLDDGRGVDNLELVTIGCDLKLVPRDNSYNREQRSGRFPALRAAAGVVVEHIATESDLDGARFAVTLELSTFEVRVALGEAVVDGRMDVESSHYGSDGI